MSLRTNLVLLVGFTLASTAPAGAQSSFVYPAKGQSPQQQAQDESQCRAWAQQQTGPAPAAPPPGGHARGTARGAARGAAGGAAVGAIAGDAGKGAAIGATVGAVRGRRGSKQAAQAQQADAASNADRAFGACMEGRGYTVK